MYISILWLKLHTYKGVPKISRYDLGSWTSIYTTWFRANSFKNNCILIEMMGSNSSLNEMDGGLKKLLIHLLNYLWYNRTKNL